MLLIYTLLIHTMMRSLDPQRWKLDPVSVSFRLGCILKRSAEDLATRCERERNLIWDDPIGMSACVGSVNTMSAEVLTHKLTDAGCNVF